MRYNTMIDSKINNENLFELTISDIDAYGHLEELFNKIISDIKEYYGIEYSFLSGRNKGVFFKKDFSKLYVEIFDGKFPKIMIKASILNRNVFTTSIDKNDILDEEKLEKIVYFIDQHLCKE